MSTAETGISCRGTHTASDTLFMFLIFSFSPTSQGVGLVSQFSKTCQQFEGFCYSGDKAVKKAKCMSSLWLILVGLRGKKKLGSISKSVSAVGNMKQSKTDGKNGKCGEWGGIIFTLGDRKASPNRVTFKQRAQRE